jgi:hypothetical protein
MMNYKRQENREWKCMQVWRRKILRNERLEECRWINSSVQRRSVWHAQIVTEQTEVTEFGRVKALFYRNVSVDEGNNL